MDLLKTLGLFVATALAEIVGCYLPYLWLKQDRSAWLLVPAAASLALFAWLLSLHPTAAGRVCSARAWCDRRLRDPAPCQPPKQRTPAMPVADTELQTPVAAGRDLPVAVKAVAVNPVDTKVRAPKDKVEPSPRVLGWDASGVVQAAGPEVSLFKVGDEVYYAGDISRPGCNAEFQLVDERIVGQKPKSLSFAEAAALPLTTITAYESFFDRLRIERDGVDAGQSILIIGAGGGVGSIGVQMAKSAGLLCANLKFYLRMTLKSMLRFFASVPTLTGPA